MKFTRLLPLTLLAGTAGLGVAQDTSGIDRAPLQGRPYSPYADRAFPTEVLFGDVHVHTSLSADAGSGGTRISPRDAYRFARREQVIFNTGQPVKQSSRSPRTQRIVCHLHLHGSFPVRLVLPEERTAW